MAKKIKVRMTEKQKQDIHDLFEHPGYKFLTKKVLAARQTQHLQLGVVLATSMEDVSYRRGAIKEHSWIIDFVKDTWDAVEAEEEKEKEKLND